MEGAAPLQPFEYLLILLSIVLGLAIADLCVSLNRLLGAGARVKWDWLAPLAALLAMEMVVTRWWLWFADAGLLRNVTYAMYLVLILTGVLLFLLAAAALPDEVGDEGVDLRAYYATTARRFWLTFAAYWVVGNAAGLWMRVEILHFDLGKLSPWSALVLLIPGAAVVVAFARSRRLHAFVLLTAALFYLTQWGASRLVGG